MFELQARQHWKKRLYSRPVLAVLLLLVILTAKGAWNMHSKTDESRKNLEEVELQKEELQAREVELRTQIERLETEQGIEEEIRKKFSVVKEGEQMVVLVDEQATITPPVEEKPGFFGRLWNRIKGIF